jgi:hypothetical protein
MDTYGHLMPTMQTDAVQNFADLIKNAKTYSKEWKNNWINGLSQKYYGKITAKPQKQKVPVS